MTKRRLTNVHFFGRENVAKMWQFLVPKTVKTVCPNKKKLNILRTNHLLIVVDSSLEAYVQTAFDEKKKKIFRHNFLRPGLELPYMGNWDQKHNFGQIYSGNNRVMSVNGFFEAYYQFIFNPNKKFKKISICLLISDKFTIFGHFGPKTYFWV